MPGIQLFGLLNGTGENMENVFLRLRELGADPVEPCLAVDPIPGMERMFWSEEELVRRAGRIRNAGMEMISCHVFARDLAGSAGKLKKICAQTGIRFMVVKSPADLSEDSLKEYASQIARAAEVLKGTARILIHNEQADIAAKVQGKTACEYLLGLCPETVGLEADVGWILAGGEDPMAFLERNAERVCLVHLKDFVVENGQWKEVSVGLGCVDTAGVLRWAGTGKLPVIADQDSYADEPFAELGEIFTRIHSREEET